MKISAVIVCYNPDGGTLKMCLDSIIAQVDVVIIVDNSVSSKWKLPPEFLDKKVHIIRNNENLGIAKALNIGCAMSISLSCDYAYTLDQDSVSPAGIIADLTQGFLQHKNAGIIAPAYESYRNMNGEKDKVCKVNHVICSGSLMSLEAYSRIGGFLNDLFIDMVDVEYCWRLRKNGYYILQDGRFVLNHRLGDSLIEKKILFKKIYYASHNPLRTYYYARNLLWVTSKYHNVFPSECSEFRYDLKKEVFKIIFISPNKWEKIHALMRAYIDYRSNKLGEYHKC